ncbi:hypothetical protein DOE76_12650 [Leifsonia sp. ku-ls]|nr:hypothetical protein DOE76_12650 [Leifsonia sp. ku-ls]
MSAHVTHAAAWEAISSMALYLGEPTVRPRCKDGVVTDPEAESDFELLRSALSRRNLVVGGLSLAALAAAGTLTPSAAVAAPALSFNQVKTIAMGEVGRTLSQVKSDLAVTGPWATYNYEWCAWFVTWLLHNNGIGYEVGAEDPYDTYARMGRVGTTPTVGSLIFFDIPASHVGLVIGTNGSSCETIEGNAGSNPWSSSVVHHNYGRVGSRYAYPVYADQDSSSNPPPIANQPGTDEEMGRLVKHPNGSVAFAATDGTFTILSTMDEVNALVATGAAPAEMINLSDGFIWNLRLQVAQKRKTQNEV